MRRIAVRLYFAVYVFLAFFAAIPARALSSSHNSSPSTQGGSHDNNTENSGVSDKAISAGVDSSMSDLRNLLTCKTGIESKRYAKQIKLKVLSLEKTIATNAKNRQLISREDFEKILDRSFGDLSDGATKSIKELLYSYNRSLHEAYFGNDKNRRSEQLKKARVLRKQLFDAIDKNSEALNIGANKGLPTNDPTLDPKIKSSCRADSNTIASINSQMNNKQSNKAKDKNSPSPAAGQSSAQSAGQASSSSRSAQAEPRQSGGSSMGSDFSAPSGAASSNIAPSLGSQSGDGPGVTQSNSTSEESTSGSGPSRRSATSEATVPSKTPETDSSGSSVPNVGPNSNPSVSQMGNANNSESDVSSKSATATMSASLSSSGTKLNSKLSEGNTLVEKLNILNAQELSQQRPQIKQYARELEGQILSLIQDIKSGRSKKYGTLCDFSDLVGSLDAKGGPYFAPRTYEIIQEYSSRCSAGGNRGN